MKWGEISKIEVESDVRVDPTTGAVIGLGFAYETSASISADPLSNKGVVYGFEANGSSVDEYLSSHDGTTQSETSKTTIASTTIVAKIKLVYDVVGGTLTGYKDGVQTFTKSTNLPTGTGGSDDVNLVFYGEE